jgi:ankyrin repeat protein
MSILLKKGVKADLTSSNGQTPLSYAAQNGHEAVVKLLLAAKGVDADSKDIYRRTPLLFASTSIYCIPFLQPRLIFA